VSRLRPKKVEALDTLSKPMVASLGDVIPNLCAIRGIEHALPGPLYILSLLFPARLGACMLVGEP
jgi:hypothetical protein